MIDKKIEEYSVQHTNAEEELLYDLNRQTHLKVVRSRMISGHLQGRILSMLSKMIAPKNILEIGTYTGYSALCLAEGLPAEGTLHTLEQNEEFAFFASKFFTRSKFKQQIIQHVMEHQF